MIILKKKSSFGGFWDKKTKTEINFHSVLKCINPTWQLNFREILLKKTFSSFSLFWLVTMLYHTKSAVNPAHKAKQNIETIFSVWQKHEQKTAILCEEKM